MNPQCRQNSENGRKRENRREFLKQTLAAAASVALPESVLAIDESAPGRAILKPVAPRVVRVTSQTVMPVRVPHQGLLRDCLSTALREFTGKNSEESAWRSILRPDDVVLLKFNQSASGRLLTTPAFATVLVDSLTEAGWSLEQLMLLEAGRDFEHAGDTRPPDYRWQGEEVEFGSSGKDSFMAALDQATALINVPFLKTHRRAIMTSCLKNLSHGLIRHPARFHANGCDPAIGQIVASDPIRSKLRLNIVNAIRVIFEGDVYASEQGIHTFGGVIMGSDPVACDAIGFSILNEIRALRGVDPLLGAAGIPPQLLTAQRLGVGACDRSKIDLRVHAF